MAILQRVVIADPSLLQELFAAEREGALAKPTEQPFQISHVRIWLHLCSDLAPFVAAPFSRCWRTCMTINRQNFCRGLM